MHPISVDHLDGLDSHGDVGNVAVRWNDERDEGRSYRYTTSRVLYSLLFELRRIATIPDNMDNEACRSLTLLLL